MGKAVRVQTSYIVNFDFEVPIDVWDTDTDMDSEALWSVRKLLNAGMSSKIRMVTSNSDVMVDIVESYRNLSIVGDSE